MAMRVEGGLSFLSTGDHPRAQTQQFIKIETWINLI